MQKLRVGVKQIRDGEVCALSVDCIAAICGGGDATATLMGPTLVPFDEGETAASASLHPC
jgi:hypothetical protein